MRCRGEAQTLRCTVKVICETCAKEFSAPKSQLAKGPVRFCSRGCYKLVAKTPMEVRFWRMVDIGEPDACWLWMGCLSTQGYGKMGGEDWKTGPEPAHRIAYRLKHGEIPTGKQINHTCDVRACVNPSHLYAGTAKENTRDAMVRGRWRSPFVSHE